MFTKQDQIQFEEKGLRESVVRQQIERFRNGFPPLPVVRPATVGDGIVRLSGEEVQLLCEKFETASRGLRMVKFVPASGAATRMFKDLYEYLSTGVLTPEVEKTLVELDRFAFYDDLVAAGTDTGDARRTVQAIVEEPLHYGHMPKGLIQFHRYAQGVRTAIEEHLVEGAAYGRSDDGSVHIHFTVSPQHQADFGELLASCIPYYEKLFGVKYEISYSRQSPASDVIAVDQNNEPVRNPDGSLVLRPAGHGALLENLGAIDADVIFVKNIDNVTTQERLTDTVLYKKALAGLLLGLQRKVFECLTKFKTGLITPEGVADAADFVRTRLHCRLPDGFEALSQDEKISLLKKALNRPIRVCGMVKNEGEPGGGPVWVRRADGSESLQIAETVQIAPGKRELLQKATHFNPVDLVCSTRNYKGKQFDLERYRDPETGLITVKSKDGKELKAQELPGLWNGSMADWITLFVEVPVSTFNPVKTVNDLLRPQHQPQ